MTFLQDREEPINDLFADLKKIDPKEPATVERAWNELRVLQREYSNEIEQSGVSRPEMRGRVLVLLDKHHESRGEMSPIERFEVIALLRVFAVEAIKDGRDKPEDLMAFQNEWVPRGISMQGIAIAGWMLARDEVVGDTS